MRRAVQSGKEMRIKGVSKKEARPAAGKGLNTAVRIANETVLPQRQSLSKESKKVLFELAEYLEDVDAKEILECEDYTDDDNDDDNNDNERQIDAIIRELLTTEEERVFLDSTKWEMFVKDPAKEDDLLLVLHRMYSRDILYRVIDDNGLDEEQIFSELTKLKSCLQGKN